MDYTGLSATINIKVNEYITKLAVFLITRTCAKSIKLLKRHDGFKKAFLVNYLCPYRPIEPADVTWVSHHAVNSRHNQFVRLFLRWLNNMAKAFASFEHCRFSKEIPQNANNDSNYKYNDHLNCWIMSMRQFLNLISHQWSWVKYFWVSDKAKAPRRTQSNLQLRLLCTPRHGSAKMNPLISLMGLSKLLQSTRRNEISSWQTHKIQKQNRK